MVRSFDVQLASGGLMPVKNSQEISKPDPDHEAEQADDIDRGQLADALLPQLA